MTRGKYVVIEGIDGSGKSALCVALRDIINARNQDVDLFKQPSYDGPVGKLLRRVFEGKATMPDKAMLHMFAADAIEQDAFVAQQLLMGHHVLMDRHTAMSALAYQTDNHSLATVIAVQPFDLFIPVDLVVYLDIDPLLAIERRRERDDQATDGKYKTDDLTKLRLRKARYALALALLQEGKWAKDILVVRVNEGDSTQSIAYKVAERMGIKSLLHTAVLSEASKILGN